MKRILLSSCLMLSLSGCGSSDFSDLQAYMDEVRARPKGQIEPLPQPEPYENFTSVSYTHLTLPTILLV